MLRRRPVVVRRGVGLLGTAAIGAVAYGVGRSAASRAADERRQNEPELVPPPAAPPATTPEERLRQLRELGELKSSGVLSDEEFQREKARILGSA